SPIEINKFFQRVFKKNIKMVDVKDVELNNYTLDDLFNNDIRNLRCSINNHPGDYLNDILILFVPVNSDYNGHYQMICKRNSRVYFFDSYGHNYMNLINKVNKSKITPVKMNDNFGKLVIESGYKIISNKFAYQTNELEDSTCG